MVRPAVTLMHFIKSNHTDWPLQFVTFSNVVWRVIYETNDVTNITESVVTAMPWRTNRSSAITCRHRHRCVLECGEFDIYVAWIVADKQRCICEMCAAIYGRSMSIALQSLMYTRWFGGGGVVNVPYHLLPTNAELFAWHVPCFMSRIYNTAFSAHTHLLHTNEWYRANNE